MKLSRLLDAVKADFLQHVKASITVTIALNPAYLFTDAMSAFKTEVLRKHPPLANGQPNPKRYIRETSTGRGGHGRGGRGGRGRGRGRGGGRNNGYHPYSQTRRAHQDEKTFTLMNGKRIKSHPSYKFSDEEWNQMHKWQRDEILNARDEYKKSNGTRDGRNHQPSISELSRQVASLQQQLSQGSIPSQVNVDNDTIASNANNSSSGSRRSIIGGRNEQERKKGPP